MTTRTSHRWTCQPGRFDTIGVRERFTSSGLWGIPTLRAYHGEAPPSIAPFGVRASAKDKQSGLHFFLDDYRFERVWDRPTQFLSSVLRYGWALTPDFSLYTDYPLAAQLWNTYRNRWLGALWQRHGVRVIPTISWATALSYSFAFTGVDPGGVVAVSGVGVRSNDATAMQLFDAGYKEMLRVLHPSLVLCYGKLPKSVMGLALVQEYPSRWGRGGEHEKRSKRGAGDSASASVGASGLPTARVEEG